MPQGFTCLIHGATLTPFLSCIGVLFRPCPFAVQVVMEDNFESFQEIVEQRATFSIHTEL